MYKNITEDELNFVALLHDPVAIKECLFPENMKAPHLWKEEDCKLFKMRNYQFSWQNYSHMLCDDKALTKAKNFEKKKLAGECYNIGGRNTGKSLDFIQLDIIIEMILGAGKELCCGAGTQGFLTKVLNPVLNLYRSHPFLKLFHLVGKKDGIRGGNDMEISAKHGGTFYGRSENIDKPEPGTKFHGLHFSTLLYEEIHYSSDKGEEKRIDSGSSLGVINRFSGIPDIRIGSPLGRILSDENNKNFVCRYPQFVRDDWSEKVREQRIEEYNGESNLKYKLNVIGQRIEGAEGFWDIERIKDKCLNKKRTIKQFDIDKKKFPNFKHHIILDRLASEQIIISADIGAGARPTEIIIVFYQNKKYRLEYNITLNKLSSRQQAEIFAWIYNYLGSAFIGLDATTDYGIKDYLVQDYDIPDNHVLSVDLRKNIAVGFVKDKDGKILKDSKGKDIVKQKRAIDWAMERLLHFMYEGKFDIPIDNKFFKEFSGFKLIQSGTRKSYDSSTTDDYHQSIPKDEIISCKIYNHFISDRIEDIYNISENIEVPTYNNGNVVWKKGKIFREKNKTNNILEFKLKPSSNLRVTEGHSVLIWNSEKQQLDQVLAKDVKIGDLMLSVANFNINEQQEYLTEKIKFYHTKGQIEVNKNFVVNEKFAYLLGWCCAEGSKSGNGAYQLSLGLKDPRNKLKQYIFDVFGIESRIDIRPPRVCIVMGGGRNLSAYIENTIGHLAKNKKVPSFILNSKFSVQDAFFQGLIEGDGDKNLRLTTISRIVTASFYTSLILRSKRASFNAHLNKFGNYEYGIKEEKRLGYYNNIPYKALPYNYPYANKTISREKIKNANYTLYPQLRNNKKILTLAKDFNFTEVKAIKKYEYNDYVYDVQVEDTHNFVAGVGNIVVHNSFQIWSITQWDKEFETLRNKNNKKNCLGYF